MSYQSNQPVHEWLTLAVGMFTLGLCAGPVAWFWAKKGAVRLWRAIAPYLRHGSDIGGGE